MKVTFIFLFIWIILPFVNYAQWNNNPGINTFVSGTGQVSTFPKMAGDKNGSVYISSWKKTASPIYFELWLQRLDALGNRLWGDDGILVSHHNCRSWLSDYSITVDTLGNAILAFEDMRRLGKVNAVYVYKISPEGNFLWGNDGIQLNSSDDMNYSPQLGFTKNGNLIIAWNVILGDTAKHDLAIRFLELSLDGQFLWHQPITYTGNDSSCMFPTIAPVGEDDIILVWQKIVVVDTAAVGSLQYKYIYAQRFNLLGHPVWASDAPVCDLGDSAFLMPEFFQISVARDNEEGLYIAWFDDRAHTNSHNIYIQHMDKNGNMLWVKNGLPVAQSGWQYSRADPLIAGLPATGDVLIFWNELNLVPEYRIGILGQKFSPDGVTHWGDLGKIFSDYSNDTVANVSAIRPGSSTDVVIAADKQFIMVNGTDTLLVDHIVAMKVDSSGQFLWNPAKGLLASYEDFKYGIQLTRSDSMYVACWSENREEGSGLDPYGKIFAQNFSFDGKLGPLGISQLSKDNRLVRIFPNPGAGSSFLLIEESCPGPVTIQVYSPEGRLMQTSTQYSMQLESILPLDGTSLPSGTYFLEIVTKCRSWHSKWIILR